MFRGRKTAVKKGCSHLTGWHSGAWQPVIIGTRLEHTETWRSIATRASASRELIDFRLLLVAGPFFHASTASK